MRRGTQIAVTVTAGLTLLLATRGLVAAAEDSTAGLAAADDSALVGWAGENGGITGGGGGETVKVSTPEAFLEAIAKPEPLIIQVEAMLKLPLREPSESLPEDDPLRTMHDVTSNKTIEGTASGAGITGGGLNIGLALKRDCVGTPIATECTVTPDQLTAPPDNRVRNVIVRNMTFSGAPDDAINIQQFSQNIWIDHNDISGAADGGLDIKRGSDFVTVSYNHFHDQDKASLVGHNDTNQAQDAGRLRVTYHHNFFDGTRQRNPRVRFGNPVHVFNNYYLNVDNYGVAATVDSGVLVESNVFEGVEDPFHLAEADSGPGTLVAKDNILDEGVTGEDGGSGQVAPIPYEYTPEPADQVKETVTANAGPKF